MTNYYEINCASALHPLKRKIPYAWDLNLYRGCQHGCAYCYALYAHDHPECFASEIGAKTNVIEHLERELSRPGWKREVVNIGGVTDSYQPAEAHYRLMPEVLKLLIKYRTPCIISTKSDLVLRDYDLIDELASITYVNIAETITCMDEDIRQKLEPGGATSLKRFEVLKTFSNTNASIGLHFMPIIPHLTDGQDNVESLYAHARDSNISYVLPGVLYLRGRTRGAFFDFIDREYPNLSQPLRTLYMKGGAGVAYKEALYNMINPIREKYGLNRSYSAPMKEKLAMAEQRQLSMFD